jgi:hypothetical protein
MKSTYKLDCVTESRVLGTLLIRISTLYRRRRESIQMLDLEFANNWHNADIRQACDTYRKFKASLTA